MEEEEKKSNRQKLYSMDIDGSPEAKELLVSILNYALNNNKVPYNDALLFGKNKLDDDKIKEIKSLVSNIRRSDALLTLTTMGNKERFYTLHEDFYKLLELLEVAQNVDVQEPENNIVEVFSPKKFNATPEESQKANEDLKKLTEGKEPEEKEAIIKEYFENTSYYINGEKMCEAFRETSIYNSISPSQRQIIERAYSQCTTPSSFEDINFLNERIGEELAGDSFSELDQIKEIHRAVLFNASIGYNIQEKNGAQTRNPETDKIDVPVVSFPEMLDDMPEWLIRDTEKSLNEELDKALNDVVNNNDAYTAIVILSEPEEVYSEGQRTWENKLDNSEYSCIMRVYVKQNEDTFREGVREKASKLRPVLEQKIQREEWEREQRLKKFLKEFRDSMLFFSEKEDMQDVKDVIRQEAAKYIAIIAQEALIGDGNAAVIGAQAVINGLAMAAEQDIDKVGADLEEEEIENDGLSDGLGDGGRNGIY